MRVGRQQVERIIAALGTVPAVKLTPRMVETRLLGLMARAGLSTSTIVQCESIGTRAFRRAMRDGLVMRNPFELAETPRGTVRRSRSMTRAQIASLLLLKMTPWWRAYLTVAIGCGLRPGELLGLRWADLDFEAGTLAVRRALHEEAGADGRISLTLADLKTAGSRRTLRMPGVSADTLRVLRAAQAAARLKAWHRWHDNGLVFCGPSA
jgi:integrase